MNSSKLTVLLPTTAYTLAYTLPLLLISILLVFAGSFLTLDRTRSFPPAEDYSALPGSFEGKNKKRKLSWRLEGGVGGLAIGYAFGVHVSTLLALLIPGTTSSSSLSPQSFLAVWILCCIPTTVLGGLRRLSALLFAGIGGGFAIAIGLSVILHPSLLPRQILLGVFSILLTALLLVGLFVPKISFILRSTLRTAASAMGALGLVISIALLSRPEPVLGWANAWERLWVANGNPEEWGTGKEKGLSAAWGVFWVLGIAGDWALSRWIGECPDEKWDNYLAKYTSDPPNHPDRAGTFQPPKSFWDKVFSKTSAKNGDTDFFLTAATPFTKEKDDIIFPSEKDMKRTSSPLPQKPPGGFVDNLYNVPPPKPISPRFKGLKKQSRSGGHVAVDIDDDVDVPTGAGFLRKKKSKWDRMVGGRRKKPIRFGTIDELSSSDSSSDEADPVQKAPTSAKDDDKKVEVVEVNAVGVEGKAKGKGAPGAVKRPWIVTNQQPSFSSDTSSAPTLVDGQRSAPRTPSIPAAPTDVPLEAVDIDYDKELERLQARLGSREVLPVYSDEENDIPVVKGPSRHESRRTSRDGSRSHSIQRRDATGSPETAWSPAFLQRHQSTSGAPPDLLPPPVHGAMPIPATPSLIRAVDRIVEAQKEAYGGQTPAHQYPSPRTGRAPGWDEFWREVSVKAQA